MGLFGPSVRVTSHRMGWGRGDVLGFVRNVAPLAVKTVEEHFGRRLQPVQITLTTASGMAELACRAEYQFAPELPAREKTDGIRLARKNARNTAGHVVLDPRGRGTFMFLNVRTDMMQEPHGIVTTMTHELVHCDQLGRRGIRDLLIAHARHEFDVETMAAQDAAACKQMVDDHETEAYSLEDTLAQQVLTALPTPA
ncbi:hypothetical protein [Streptomyces sp. NBC_01361]|uniref:hypothetical protein n=1 Tax=Streptomyces sp. NBC_01361 TaxID=2903838 RepID=UPI002E370DEA|nr:hypothetical protein [Streptomyces sp. NBC_01361]